MGALPVYEANNKTLFHIFAPFFPFSIDSMESFECIEKLKRDIDRYKAEKKEVIDTASNSRSPVYVLISATAEIMCEFRKFIICYIVIMLHSFNSDLTLSLRLRSSPLGINVISKPVVRCPKDMLRRGPREKRVNNVY